MKQTKVHQKGDLAELVYSNSLKSNSLDKATGLTKWEMQRLDLLILQADDESALAVVGRSLCSVTYRLEQHPNIELVREEATEISVFAC